MEPEIQNKAEEETAVFRCEASGKPQPKIRWIHNGRPIGEKSHQNNIEITTNMIRIFNLSKADTGNYGCNATNENGYVYKDVYVNVLGMCLSMLNMYLRFVTFTACDLLNKQEIIL